MGQSCTLTKVHPHGAIEIKDHIRDHIFKVNVIRWSIFLEMSGEEDVECLLLHDPPQAEVTKVSFFYIFVNTFEYVWAMWILEKWQKEGEKHCKIENKMREKN